MSGIRHGRSIDLPLATTSKVDINSLSYLQEIAMVAEFNSFNFNSPLCICFDKPAEISNNYIGSNTEKKIRKEVKSNPKV